MDWNLVIERHGRALRQVLAMLVAMANLTGDNPVLHSRLYRKILGLLRPAESAARRLIVIAARGITVPLPPPRKPKPKRKSVYVRPGGTGIVVPWGVKMPDARPRSGTISLSVVDPSYRMPKLVHRSRSVPRISFIGSGRPEPARPTPNHGGYFDATRLGQRLAALGRALDDLPKYALRLARWTARRNAGLVKRCSPLRLGAAYGRRGKYARRPIHEVDGILSETHYFARLALTSDPPAMPRIGGT